jgi:hypothetical protein
MGLGYWITLLVGVCFLFTLGSAYAAFKAIRDAASQQLPLAEPVCVTIVAAGTGEGGLKGGLKGRQQQQQQQQEQQEQQEQGQQWEQQEQGQQWAQQQQGHLREQQEQQPQWPAGA